MEWTRAARHQGCVRVYGSDTGSSRSRAQDSEHRGSQSEMMDVRAARGAALYWLEGRSRCSLVRWIRRILFLVFASIAVPFIHILAWFASFTRLLHSCIFSYQVSVSIA